MIRLMHFILDFLNEETVDCYEDYLQIEELKYETRPCTELTEAEEFEQARISWGV